MKTLSSSIYILANLARRENPGSRPGWRPAVILATLFVLILLTLARPALSSAQGPPPVGGTTTSINDGPGDQRDTHIHGTIVAYSSITGGTSEVRFYDLLTGADVAIPTGSALDFLSDIYGSTIVYTHVASNKFAINAYDTAAASQPPVELDPQPGSLREKPAIGGQTVAWIDYGLDNDNYHSEIVVYDLTTSSATRLTDDDYYNRDPDISPDGSTVVWTRCESYSNATGWGGCRIWQTTRSDSGGWSVASTVQISGDQESMTPVLNDQFIAYQGIDANGESDIYWRLRDSSVEHRISLAGPQGNPAISGGVLVFESLNAGAPTPSLDILLYDLAAGLLYTVADTPAREFEPDVAVGPDGLIRVVWTTGGTSDANVYARTFSLPAGDTTSPTITIAVPAATPYMLNQVVPADYACADESGGSGLASCAGPVASGSPIDTATVGVKTFTVTATDHAGNTASQSVSYTVTYNICVLYDQSKSHKLGSTVPIKLQLCDAANANVSAADIVVHATELTKLDNTAAGALADIGNANPDNDFRFEAGLGGSGGYIYNLSTRDLSAGTWALGFTVDGDPLTHAVEFDLR